MLEILDRIALPPHPLGGGFDHAAIHAPTSRLYVAHPANDGVDVIDLATGRYLRSLGSRKGVAGVGVGSEPGWLFTSNRGEDSVSLVRLPDETEVHRLPTGARPNGLALDARRQTLLVAGVGNPETGAPPTATLFHTSTGERLHQFPLPGPTRWALFHEPTDAFYVNIAKPPMIAQIEGAITSGVRRSIPIPAGGPHGLEQDPNERNLYCACDDGRMVIVDLPGGTARVVGELAGTPDVIWLNPRFEHLYVAIGDPGVVQLFQTDPWSLLQTMTVGAGAHTLTVDPRTGQVHVFLPGTHEDLVLVDA
ncbi:MAG: hypothetical protein L3K15_02330 [Thermoplasmata archaeon]|nr:hypothetical protein [Thermoplasmata archaeon]